MNGQKRTLRTTNKVKFIIGTVLILVFVWLVSTYFDFQTIKDIGMFIIKHPFLLVSMFFVYLSAFLIRAYAWYLYMQKRVLFKVCVSGVFYSMFFNHLLPFKGGDLVRIGVVLLERGRKIKKDEVIHSVIVMRLLDLIVLVSITAIGLFFTFQNVFLSPTILVGILILFSMLLLFFFLAKSKFQNFYQRQLNLLIKGLTGFRGIFLILTIICSWFFEGIIVFGFLIYSSNAITIYEAIWVNSLTVGGQFFQITPGGAATYEAIMTFGLKVLSVSFATGLSVALISHLFKFIFSFIVGAFAYIMLPIDITRICSLFKERGFS